mgnify:CR=1 FL=1
MHNALPSSLDYLKCRDVMLLRFHLLKILFGLYMGSGNINLFYNNNLCML